MDVETHDPSSRELEPREPSVSQTLDRHTRADDGGWFAHMVRVRCIAFGVTGMGKSQISEDIKEAA